jgi:hypothetical protein
MNSAAQEAVSRCHVQDCLWLQPCALSTESWCPLTLFGASTIFLDLWGYKSSFKMRFCDYLFSPLASLFRATGFPHLCDDLWLLTHS